MMLFLKIWIDKPNDFTIINFEADRREEEERN